MELKFLKIWILGTKAKPPIKISHNRHNPILLKTEHFRGGLTLVRNYFRQPSNHRDSSAQEWLVFLARRKS
jgi:hypothetical protein